MNLLELIRVELGYPPFRKIDPNTEEMVVKPGEESRHQKTGQAVITAVLAGFYQLSRTEKGFNYLINKDSNVPWSVALFGKEALPVVENIAQYSGSGNAEVSSIIDEAGNTAWQMAASKLEGKLNHKGFEHYFDGIMPGLLTYLPPELQLGQKLYDNSLDDRIHKMEGPVSGLMHKIGDMF